jgi:hypothetical protein
MCRLRKSMSLCMMGAEIPIPDPGGTMTSTPYEPTPADGTVPQAPEVDETDTEYTGNVSSVDTDDEDDTDE